MGNEIQKTDFIAISILIRVDLFNFMFLVTIWKNFGSVGREQKKKKKIFDFFLQYFLKNLGRSASKKKRKKNGRKGGTTNNVGCIFPLFQSNVCKQ